MARLSIPPKWGIRIFAFWSLVLAVLAAAQLLILSAVSETVRVEAVVPIWIISSLDFVFALGFGASAYGLWKHHTWGRIMFLGLIIIWSGFNFASLLVSRNLLTAGYPLFLNSLRYAAALVIPWLYFNLPNIRLQFSDNKSTEDVPTHDTIL